MISADRQDDPDGDFFVIEGNVVNPESLAAKTSIVYDCDLNSSSCIQQDFTGLGRDNGIDTALREVYLREGSLQLVVEVKSKQDEFCDLYQCSFFEFYKE